MIIQPIDETSVATKVVAVAVVTALITKLVPPVIVPIVNCPTGLAPVAPMDCLVSKIIEFAVTAVVATVTVPPTRVTLPKLFAPAAAVEPTLVERILFPAVPRTKFPFVAVIAPKVAVTVVAAVTDPKVETRLPVLAVMFPVVAITPVAPVTVDVAAIEPGAIKAAGIDNVIVLPAPALVIWLAVPNIEIFPAAGLRAPPLPPVTVTTPPTEPEPAAVHVATPPEMRVTNQTVLLEVFTHSVPMS